MDPCLIEKFLCHPAGKHIADNHSFRMVVYFFTSLPNPQNLLQHIRTLTFGIRAVNIDMI